MMCVQNNKKKNGYQKIFNGVILTFSLSLRTFEGDCATSGCDNAYDV